MRSLKSVVLITIFLVSQSCSKECDEIKGEHCSDSAINETACQGIIYDRWFFDKKSNSCSIINYTGCGPNKGFSTKQECEDCKCK